MVEGCIEDFAHGFKQFVFKCLKYFRSNYQLVKLDCAVFCWAYERHWFYDVSF